MNYLFENFLTNENESQQNLNFLKEIFADLSKNELPEYYDIKFSETEEQHEGCPVFLASYNWRTCKIIQGQPNSERPVIFANLENHKELTLEIELSQEILPMLKYYLRMWLVEGVSPKGMDTIIDFNSQLAHPFGKIEKEENSKNFQEVEKNENDGILTADREVEKEAVLVY